MELDDLKRIKTLAVVALFTDDEMMEQLVLKGGNALDLIYQVSTRASLDVDLSLESQISDFPGFRGRVARSLANTFAEHGYHVFDVTVDEVPSTLSEDVKDFWGGYRIEFKLANNDVRTRYQADLPNLRRNAEVVGPAQKRKFKIDISKHEYCFPKRAVDLLGYRVFVYSPELLVVEKLRALCQQLPEYASIIPNPSRRPRARDFVDIHALVEKLQLDFHTPDCRTILIGVFEAKRVPIDWLLRIREYRDYHAGDFQSVKATVHAGVQLLDFDSYFDYVVSLGEKLHAYWME